MRFKGWMNSLKHPYTIYPPSLVDLYDSKEPLVVILGCNKNTMEAFINAPSEIPSIIGMDSEYVTNNLRLPITVVCSQNQHYNTIPAFVALMGKSDTVHYQKVLLEIKKYLLEVHHHYLAGFGMIDKDLAERNALVNAGFEPIICDFQAIKTFGEILLKFFKIEKDQFQCFQIIKKIQRSEDLIEYEEYKEELLKFCQKRKKTKFWDYFGTNWISHPWESAWIDMGRPGERKGLWNTNNGCESFFKKLLRTFLKGIGGRAPQTVLEIIENNCFQYYENYFSQLKFGILSPMDNPSTQRDKISMVQFAGFQGQHIRVTLDNVTFLVQVKKNECSCNVRSGKCVHIKFCERFLPNFNGLPDQEEDRPPRTFPERKKPGRKRAEHFTGNYRGPVVNPYNLAAVTTQAKKSGPKQIVCPQGKR